MGTKLYKNGDQMGIWTDAEDEREFLDQLSRLWDNLIDRGWCVGDKETGCDWEFQFLGWLPQVVEICCKYRGYKSNVKEAKVLFCGDIIPDDFIAEVTSTGSFGVKVMPEKQEVENGREKKSR